MGLDMFLTKRVNVQNWNYTPKEDKIDISIQKGGKQHPYINTDKISNVEEEVAYWRKANHIHNWFVQNVQGGKDDCREYYIGIDNLKELLETCKEVLEGGEATAKRLLPRTTGFFFGSTDYDEYYESSIKDTIKIIEEILKDVEEGYLPYEIYYRSSW